jgi:hypothetical protein
VATRGAFVAHVCRVVRLLPLQGYISVRISATPSKMGDGLIAVSIGSNYTFIMLYLCHEMDVDYLLVEVMVNISKLFDYSCMFSTGANL